jgi:enterochelin esterase-like enzyme
MHVRLSLLAITVCVATSALLAQNPDRPRGGRREQPPVELKHLTFQEVKFASEAVGQEVPFGLYLPKGYDDAANKDVKYPLVIWLHGMWEDHMRFHGRGGAPLLDKAVGDGTLPPCVFVCANGGRTSMYVNRKDQKWEDLITVDLLAHLTRNYRVTERRDERAIMGVSMGGMAALRIAFTKPQAFGTVAVHSAAIFAEDPDQLPERLKGMANRLGLDEEFGNPIQKEPWQKANPLCIAGTADDKALASLAIYFDAGTNDRLGLHAGNLALHEKLEQRKIAHTWRSIAGGGHSWGDQFQHEALPHSFAFVGGKFAAARKDAMPAPAKAADAKGDSAGK